MESHNFSLVAQSGEEMWSIKQVILLEIQPIIYWPRLTNPSILHATTTPICSGSEKNLCEMLPSWCQGWCQDTLFGLCCRCHHKKFSHAHQTELHIHVSCRFNMADSISVPWVWWLSYSSNPSPQIPNTGNIVSKHHAYNKSVSKEKSTFSSCGYHLSLLLTVEQLLQDRLNEKEDL